MPRIPDHLVEGAAFMFRTKQEAESRAKIGGTAFVVSKLMADSKEIAGQELFVPYLVSCKHVIFAAAASVASVNRWDGGAPDSLETEPTDWIEHPDGDDLVAICMMNQLRPTRHKLSHIDSRSIIKKEAYAPLQIGVGDEVFMIGRFINHQGQKQNRAAARFGSISMMSEDIWVKRTNRFQESLAVEMRSRTGFSGSAVIVYRTPATVLADVTVPDFWGVLGVNWGYIKDEDDENTWLNGVVPGWKILELLETPALRAQHEGYEAELRKIVKDHGGVEGVAEAFAGPSAAPPSAGAEPNHRERFTALLNVAAKKRESKE